jgi:hypothetical protein
MLLQFGRTVAMSIDSAIARWGYFWGCVLRLTTTRTPRSEKRFKQVFGFTVDLEVSMRRQHLFHIRNRLREFVKEWVDADKKFGDAYENFTRTRRSVQSSSRANKNFNLRFVYDELNKMDRERLMLWQKANDACVLPATVGYSEVSTSIEAYMPPTGVNTCTKI